MILEDIFIVITHLVWRSAILTGMEPIAQNIVEDKMIRTDIFLAKTNTALRSVIQDGMEFTAQYLVNKKIIRMHIIPVTKHLG